MIGYVTLCYVMSCHVMSRHVTSRHVMSFYYTYIYMYIISLIVYAVRGPRQGSGVLFHLVFSSFGSFGSALGISGTKADKNDVKHDGIGTLGFNN